MEILLAQVGQDGSPSLGYLFITAVAFVLVTLMVREIVCWYLKLTPILNTLHEIAGHLAALRTESLTGSSVTAGGAERVMQAEVGRVGAEAAHSVAQDAASAKAAEGDKLARLAQLHLPEIAGPAKRAKRKWWGPRL